MPYINKKRRNEIDCLIEFPDLNNKGELEYFIFKTMIHYMNDKEYKYSNLHDCVYATQHCSDEFRRRFLDKREDEAIKENGDIEL